MCRNPKPQLTNNKKALRVKCFLYWKSTVKPIQLIVLYARGVF